MRASDSGLIHAPKRSKFNARKTMVDGITFDSKREATRYQALKLLQKAGKIRGLEFHQSYELVVNGVKIGRYTCDFRYQEFDPVHLAWVEVVEDSKGVKTRDYVLRKKLMLACYRIAIRET